MYIYMCVYICMCVCVCVCVYIGGYGGGSGAGAMWCTVESARGAGSFWPRHFRASPVLTLLASLVQKYNY